ncbi:MAG: hypothetical protein C0429_09645 [Sphingopyxis sp.]|nr:hypothetical protein [Sphingopyxis sp.]
MAKAKKPTQAKTPSKHPGGRPTVYSASVVKKAREYMKSCEDKVFKFWKTRGEKSDSYDRLVKVNLPTIEGLAIHLGVHRDTIQEWKGKHKEFSVTLDELMAIQATRLMQNGLSGNYNPQMAKFLLQANHGMKERVDQTTDDKPLPQPIINVPRNDIDAKD